VAVSADREAVILADAYLDLLNGRGSFLRNAASTTTMSLQACAEAPDTAEQCIRSALDGAEISGAFVAVFVTKKEGDVQSWKCVGTGDKASSTQRQNIQLSLNAALFGDVATSFEEQKLASGCVIAAAAESGW
jgi:hypothetical protein